MPTVTLIGRRYPLLLTAELADAMNAAAKGKSRWTPARVRRLLLSAGAARQAAGLEVAATRSRAARPWRPYYTTAQLLRDALPEVYQTVAAALSDEEEFTRALAAAPPEFNPKEPPYLDPGELAAALNTASGGRAAWTTRTMRLYLRAHEALVPRPVRHRARTKGDHGWWCTTTELLREKTPDLWEALFRG